jgi:hypothetical protein
VSKWHKKADVSIVCGSCLEEKRGGMLGQVFRDKNGRLCFTGYATKNVHDGERRERYDTTSAQTGVEDMPIDVDMAIEFIVCCRRHPRVVEFTPEQLRAAAKSSKRRIVIESLPSA